MEYSTIFHLMSDLSKRAGVRCVLIGAFAVNFYKVSRQTADADFLITKDDFGKIETFLKKAGYKIDYNRDVFTRLTSAGGTYMIDADFMFVDKRTLDKILDDAKSVKIAGNEFLVPSLNNLIALKLHALKHNFKLRETKDLGDIVEMIRFNKLDFKSKKFHNLCLRYGTEKIYDKIIERLNR